MDLAAGESLILEFMSMKEVLVTEMQREYLDFAARLEKLRVIEYELQKQIVSKKKKWRLIVERIVDVVFLRARQNIAFRSHRDEGVSKLVYNSAYETNSGNFLEVIRL